MVRSRGRKSAASVAIAVNVSGKPSRLTAPASMTSAEKALFNELVAGCSAEHFRRSDIPLLTSYVEASLLARSAARDPERVAIWSQSVKLQCTLATRLRLAPSARSDPKTIGRNGDQAQLRWPWESEAQFEARLQGNEPPQED